jgi:anti-sigma regulatory factor (Ser/Thr protein kinase)
MTKKATTATLAALTAWITPAALAHPLDLPAEVARRLACSPRRARALVNQLEGQGWLVRSGTLRKPCWTPGVLRQVVQRYTLAGLEEDLPWRRDFAPCFELPPQVARIAQHAFMELLNNAIDHSGGTRATVSMRQTALHLQLLVSDDGIGLFDRVADAHDIADPALAMFELAKGKLTSQPARHAGRGLFFTARLADVFDLHANRNAYQRRHLEGRGWIRSSARAATDRGTTVFVGIALDTERTLDEVLRSASLEGEGYGLERISVPLRLLTGDGSALDSRAQARRVAARLTEFQRAELDFEGVAEIGHSFADELFRVLPATQPQLTLHAVHTAAPVARMIEMVRAA